MLTGSTTDACDLLEINKSTLTSWNKIGLGAKIARDKWNLTELIRWWSENINTQGEVTDVTIKDEERRYKSAKADKMEIEVKKMRFDLLPRDQVEAALIELIVLTKRRLVLIPKLFPVDIRAKVETAIDEALADLKDGANIKAVEQKIKSAQG